MNTSKLLLVLLVAVSSAPTIGFAADAEAGLAVVTQLGGVNGTALACSDMKAAARARQLMLAHAPKTPRFGTAYEDSTQAAFTTQTGSGKACPSDLELTDQLNRLSLRLAETLPVTAK
jgi:hypothetical protein